MKRGKGRHTIEVLFRTRFVRFFGIEIGGGELSTSNLKNLVGSWFGTATQPFGGRNPFTPFSSSFSPFFHCTAALIGVHLGRN